jgi:hypothetical protein
MFTVIDTTFLTHKTITAYHNKFIHAALEGILQAVSGLGLNTVVGTFMYYLL